ncbi:methyltransferase domain-containing protein [Parvibaculum sp.]|jgi:SAM-dependent methyltransferase|uniref:class I SAM-dependent methyltransferase n=1 Tax=Parvibaculum sp. TaxID=2024848 RepID=UPI000C4E6482|nr:methyltransferase domain-containing protein [Parvibaculum sp.]MAM94856.1 SAM-dependent methyltransferase [Parvibaculum sp.]HCX67949.1 SAM-dependent methyltransferase [Rhodobiaceae bacterium]|tara:strand:- start:18144 stop:18878 length:735 start_codon:yes stop_codon:yes gene_type:complete
MNKILDQHRPEYLAGGFSRHEGAIQFFTRVQALISPEFTVMDFGAGRGLFLEDKCPYRRNLRTLKGKVTKVVGVDVDPAVLTNEGVDETHIIDPTAPLPFPDASFDMVISDWVLEHLENPEAFASHMLRVLKPGGWLCARTPNKWGLTALSARIIPNALHVSALSRLQPTRQEQDVFPTFYRLNTLSAIDRLFPRQQWDNCSYLWRGEPKYFGNSLPLFRAMELWNALVPTCMATDLFVFLRKK